MLFGISFFGVLLICELFIRVTHIGSVSMMEFYDDIGRGWRKDLNFLYFNEGFGIGKYNEYKYIGEAHPPQKDSNTFRAALIGDSFIASFQVFERDYFGNIAETILNKQFPQKQFELLNFGRAGFDIADMYAYQTNLIVSFQPDLIFYLLSKGDLIPKYPDPLRPKTIIENDSLKISFNYPQAQLNLYEKTKIFTQNSCVLSMLNDCRNKAMETPISAVLLEKVYTWINPIETVLNSVQDEDPSYQINPVTLKIVQNLDEDKVIFVNRTNSRFPQEFRILCEQEGFKFIDLSIPLKGMKESGIDPNGWKVTGKTGHWNQYAHRVVGAEIAKQIAYILDSEDYTQLIAD